MLRKNDRLHFIGIGGIGVSAVARIAIGLGYRVSGSDVRRSQLTDMMKALGATVMIGHHASNIHGSDFVIVSTAIPKENIELLAAAKLGIPIHHRSDLLARFLRETNSIGVTGTHGKGTTSAMITRILDAAGLDPGFIIGGILNNYGINARAGKGDLIVAEVDESDGSHLNVPTHHLLCNYLEADHLNYYDDLEHIIVTMVRAVEKNPLLKTVFVNNDCAGNRDFIARLQKNKNASYKIVTYGVETKSDFSGQLIDSKQLPIRFLVRQNNSLLGEVSLPLPGRYNVVNAMGAIAVSMTLGVPFAAVQKGLFDFKGLENRFTIMNVLGVSIVKDYNSHPTAMRKVLESARDLTDGRIFSVFKPYRYTLTNYLKDEYATAFAGSDEVVITTMYAANEDPIPGIDTEFVVEMLRKNGHKVAWIPDQDKIVDHLDEIVQSGDKVIFFGGDDFFQMADKWASKVKKRGMWREK